MHICTHTQTSSQACTNPRHLFFIITTQSAGGKVGPCYAAAVHRLSMWGGLSLTLGLKHESLLRSTGKTQRGAEREQWGGVVWYTSCTGTQLCPLQALIHTHIHTHTACGTGFVLSDLAVILLLQDNNSQEDKSTVQVQAVYKVHSWGQISLCHVVYNFTSCPVWRGSCFINCLLTAATCPVIWPLCSVMHINCQILIKRKKTVSDLL